MNRPDNIPVREWLIKQVSEELQMSAETIEKVVSNQFKQVNKATAIYDGIEISGFGKLLHSQTKIGRRIKKTEGIKRFIIGKLESASVQDEVIKWTKALEDVNEKELFYKSRLKP